MELSVRLGLRESSGWRTATRASDCDARSADCASLSRLGVEGGPQRQRKVAVDVELAVEIRFEQRDVAEQAGRVPRAACGNEA